MNANKKVLILCCMAVLLWLPLLASNAVAADMAALVNTAGMQRMLSQRIAKDYLFLGSQIRAGKATRQMQGSLALVLNNHDVLKKSVTDTKVQGLLGEIDPLLDKLTRITKAPYVKSSGASMLELSQSLLELNQAVVESLEGQQAEKTVTAVNIAGRQRMLSQRIGMLYAARQAGLANDSTAAQMRQAVAEFESAHASLEGNSLNSDKINRELQGVENLWKTIRHYFTDNGETGYPVTIFVTTDDIMKRMNVVTLLYVKAHWVGKSQ
ncbi:type IV pili methyl-accepting chemotaxis transducer N-terminal domain-containing protein [Sedimenticola hydrogenitrophicus]|uniref:type IV pili methyl-accepting chemotaxis transducer N-terminal domain-containing protein n=1 Tax=Sedimenticola hydrogenitrophicus TaxID=2967975 RepID=UPI0021A890FF|nr:type IV pili methyl-accepting chemotaxis transducer N-terminal domain-containing protein [Sedimenticola hydrogenitrophicus]